MPCGDGTGPMGWGPGMGAGRLGGYRGWGCHGSSSRIPHRSFPGGCWGPWSFTPEEEKEFLKRRAEWLKKEQEWIDQRMKDLGEKEKAT
jgi:hypothetical protein